MAIVVEDGSGKADANAYDTAANANAYYTDMGYSDTATDATMIRASRTMDALYRQRLKGYKSSSGQALVWPRDAVDDEDGNSVASDSVPTLWKHAVYEMARVLPADQAVDPTQWVKRVKAGSAEVEFASAFQVRSVLQLVEELISIFLVARHRIVRA